MDKYNFLLKTIKEKSNMNITSLFDDLESYIKDKNHDIISTLADTSKQMHKNKDLVKPKKQQVSAKNLEIKMPNLTEEDKKNILNWEYFKGDKIEIIEDENDITKIRVLCKKKRRFSQKNKKLVFNGKKPISVTSLNKSIKCFPWMNNEKLRKYVNISSELIDNIDHNINLICFINNPNEFIGKQFIHNLKKEMLRIIPKNSSEVLLSCLLFRQLYLLSDCDSFELLSIDSKFREVLKPKNIDINTDFRVDMAFIYNRNLVIIENKYRSERNNQEHIDAYTCIVYRAYPQRLLNYLYNLNNSNYNFDNVLLMGIGYCNINTEINMSYVTINPEDIDLKSYKTIEFVENMRKNKRRFKLLSQINNYTK
jgi:hypothetical protein